MRFFDWKLLLGCFLLGICITIFTGLAIDCYKYPKKISLTHIKDRILTLWYPLLLIMSTIYVLCNYTICSEFQLFSKFNGDNLIFFICILLWLIPLFDKFEIFGANFELRRQNEQSRRAADEAIQSQGTNNKEQLEKMIERKEEKEDAE